MTFPASEMSEHLARMARSKAQWLRDHGNKRPAHEVETQTTNLNVLEQASLAYAAKAKKEQT